MQWMAIMPFLVTFYLIALVFVSGETHPVPLSSSHLKDVIKKKRHDKSSLVHVHHKGSPVETHHLLRSFQAPDADEEIIPNSIEFDDVEKSDNLGEKEAATNMKIKTHKENSPIHVADIGDEHVTSGTFIQIEYINHVNYSCTDGFVDLDRNYGTKVVYGTILGKCNPHLKRKDTLTLKSDNSFELHWTEYQFLNCSGTSITYSRIYPPTSQCEGNSKYMYQKSETSHNLFPLLKDKNFIFPAGTSCFTDREDVLSYELHNRSLTQYDTSQCWDMHYHTILIEADTLSLVTDSTLIGQKFESRDDPKCLGYPVKVEGWILNECESLGESYSTKLVWIDVGSLSGYLFAGYAFYDTYDCSDMPVTLTHRHYGTPDVCGHGGIVFQHSPQSVISWKDWSFDSHMEDYNSQHCNDAHTYHWATYNSECVMRGNERVQFDNCLRYSHYQSFDDDELNAFTSYQAFCHDDSTENANVCFHESSLITYKHQTYSLSELLAGKEVECVVPHTPVSRGVIITANCPQGINETSISRTKSIRLTESHLVSTPMGYRQAYAIKKGDVLFGGFSDEVECAVMSVEREASTQTYFGLNCLHSEVLVNGIRVSTFGDYHALPSRFMSYFGGVFGVSTASVIGDFLTDYIYYKL